MNKAYITQNLCENRDKPELRCCGKCVLKKKLTATEGSNAAGRELSTRFQLGELSADVLPSGFAVMLTHCPPDAAMQAGRLASWVEMTFVNQCFKPPCAL